MTKSNRKRWRLYYNHYIKNYYKLIVVDLSLQKELDADPKAIRQIGVDGRQFWFILTTLEKKRHKKGFTN